MSQNHSDNEQGPGEGPEMDPVAVLQAKLTELSNKHDEAMAKITALSGGTNRSYVYLPRERPIQPFSGDTTVDGRSVDEFLEEVQRAIRARGLGKDEQVDFILSLLRGSALEEIRLCTDGELKEPEEILSFLREAYREKRSVAQLLQTFYSRHQLEGEDFFEYSHTLSQILRSVLKQKADAVSDSKMAVRDQFVEGVKDPTLRRELRKMIRDNPGSSLFDVRQEAVVWSQEDRPSTTKVVKSRNISCGGGDAGCQVSGSTQEKSSATLDDILKVVSEQGKAIGELVNGMKEGVSFKEKSYKGGKPRPKFQFTDDGKPVCLRCKGVGHMARDCRPRQQEGQSTAQTAPSQGN